MEELPFDEGKLISRYNPSFAIAYGSGAFKQSGYSDKDKPMIDFILAVDNTFEWHKENLDKNPKDYSGIVKLLGSRFADILQEWGAGVYYNAFVDFEGQMIKYGVLSEERLKKDLSEWSDFYVAGRMHKPVKILTPNEDLESAIRYNLQSAVNTSLLLLPDNFSQRDLFETIAGLSYKGDSRMKHGENPMKVQNIVDKNEEGFHDLYNPILQEYSDLLHISGNKIIQDKSLKAVIVRYISLPKNLRHTISGFSKGKTPPVNFDVEESLRVNITQGISAIVYQSSMAQTMKGLLTAGVVNSAKYVGAKLKKAKSK